MKRRVLALVMALLMVLSLAGCQSNTRTVSEARRGVARVLSVYGD